MQSRGSSSSPLPTVVKADEVVVDENARGGEVLDKAAKVVTIDKDGDGDADVVVITEVSDAAALEELKWWQQGDTALEQAEVIEARQGNRRKQEVLEQVRAPRPRACTHTHALVHARTHTHAPALVVV